MPNDTMTEVETDYDSRYDDVDVESILARVGRRPLTFARKRCLYQAPEFVKRLPAEETVEEGTTVSFACKIVGFPKPTVTWFKDDDVIGEDCRAKIDVDENGIHSISLKDVSKCDSGVYKCKASNLEGSSANNLYVSVKARSRNRKKKKTRMVTCAPPFPAIVERVAEENKETLEVELQPESPLTPLYCNISLRSPVSWPAFLGEWAYCMEMAKQDDEDLEMGSEDVFDDDDIQTTLTFASSNYADDDNIDNTTYQNSNIENIRYQNSNVDNITDRNRNLVMSKDSDSDKKGTHLEKEVVDIALNANEVVSRFEHSLKRLPGVVIERDCDNTNDLDTGQKHKHEPFRDEITGNKKDIPKIKEDTVNNNTAKPVAVPPKTLDIKANVDTGLVARISVNRSYAKGDSTFSVATRSSSPYPSVFKTGKTKTDSENTNNNLSKESNMVRERGKRSDSVIWDDNMLELVFLISGSTFLALCLDLPPALFIFYVFVALLIRTIVNILLAEFKTL